MDEMRLEDDIEQLLALLDQLHPDPIGEFEDLLAERLGLTHHPDIPDPVWRALRVRAIAAAG